MPSAAPALSPAITVGLCVGPTSRQLIIPVFVQHATPNIGMTPSPPYLTPHRTAKIQRAAGMRLPLCLARPCCSLFARSCPMPDLGLDLAMHSQVPRESCVQSRSASRGAWRRLPGHFSRCGMPAVTNHTSCAARAKAWLSQPASSRNRRARALSGTMPCPTSLETSSSTP